MRQGSPATWVRSAGVTLAAVLLGTFAGSMPAQASLELSTFSGTLAPGASQNHIWVNLPSNTVYTVGLSPVGASTAAACEFEVTNQYWERLSNGQRNFRATIKNIGSLACGTNVLLSATGADPVQATGGMEPDEIKTFSVRLSSAGQLTAAPLLGLVPSGATGANPCRFKVRRTWFQRSRLGDVQQAVYLRYEVQNVGAIACSADVELGTVEAGSVSSAKTVAAGASASSKLGNATPLTATYLIGLNPVELNCTMEITRSWYRQVVDSSGASARELGWTMKNLGSSTCSAERLLPRI